MTVWDTITNTTAVRNDFMSHGSYVTLIAIAGMTVGTFWTDTTWVVALIGAIVGMSASFIRETYDELLGPSFSWYDILAGACGTLFAVLCIIILRGGF